MSNNQEIWRGSHSDNLCLKVADYDEQAMKKKLLSSAIKSSTNPVTAGIYKQDLWYENDSKEATVAHQKHSM